MFPYSFDNFNITRSQRAAMFFSIENVTIRANLTHADVTSQFSSSITISASGKNVIELELDSVDVKGFGSANQAGGVILTSSLNSIINLSVRVKNYLNVSGDVIVGGFIAYVQTNSSVDINAIIDTITVKGTGPGSFGGIIGTKESGTYMNVNLQASLISIIDSFPMGRLKKVLGAIYGNIANVGRQINNNIQNNIQIDNVIIEGNDFYSTGSVVCAKFTLQFVNHQATLIRGMHVNIQTSTSNAIGIGEVNNRVREIFPIYLLSINGTLGSPNHILAPQGISCEGSMIDWSGVHLNTNNLGCTGTLELETLRPEHWREAHRLVAIELCQDQNNCFYVHEDFLALVKERDNSFFLVTRQRYPYNNANDGQGVVRVIQYTLEDPAYTPILNTSFAINGTRLFTNETETLLPVTSPLSVSLTDDHQLLMLYGATGNLKVASMPLRATNDTTYTIHDVQSDATPVQIDNGIIWLNQQGNVLAYNISNGVAQAFSQANIVPSQANLIGAKRYQDRVYTAQIENNMNLLITRLFNNGNPDLNWSYVLPLPNDYRTAQLNVEGDTNDPIVSFSQISELFRADFLNDFYLTIEIPPRGGVGEWSYGNESFIQMLLPEPPTFESTTDVMGNMTTTQTIIPVDIMNSTDGNPNDNGGNGGTIAAGILVPIFLIGSSTATAVVTIIVCHKKKVPYFVNLEEKIMQHLKKCYVSCQKTDASDL